MVALNGVFDQSALIKVAYFDEDAEVSKAAVAKLIAEARSVRKVAEPIDKDWYSKAMGNLYSIQHRVDEYAQLSEQIGLAADAINAQPGLIANSLSSNSRRNWGKDLTLPHLLADVALNAVNWEVRIWAALKLTHRSQWITVAIEHLTDEAALAKVAADPLFVNALDTTPPDLATTIYRRNALQRIEDQTLLALVASYNESPVDPWGNDVRWDAVNKLTDRTSLEKIAAGAGSRTAQLAAKMRLPPAAGNDQEIGPPTRMADAMKRGVLR
jgi:hypothetical protein